MKFTNYLILCFTFLLFLNCSTSDDNNDSETTDPITIEKDLLKMTGDAIHWLNYEDGKINKASPCNNSIRLQMTYNLNGTISKIYSEDIGSQNNENFEWEIPVSENYIENVYENGNLIFIMEHNSGYSWKLVDYTYQGELVIEKRTYYNGGTLFRYFRYEYNNENELISIIWDESPSGGSSHILQVTFDDKVNPYYKIWKESKLTFWNAQSGPARYNLEFYPHNVLSLQEGVNDTWYNAFYTYDEDNLPISMHINEGVEAGDDNYFEYL